MKTVGGRTGVRGTADDRNLPEEANGLWKKNELEHGSWRAFVSRLGGTFGLYASESKRVKDSARVAVSPQPPSPSTPSTVHSSSTFSLILAISILFSLAADPAAHSG